MQVFLKDKWPEVGFKNSEVYSDHWTTWVWAVWVHYTCIFFITTLWSMVGWLGNVQHRYQRQPINYGHIFNCTEGRRPLLLCCLRVSCIQLQFWTLLWNCPKLSSFQLLSCVWLFANPWTTAHQASLSIINSRSLPELMSTESVMPSNRLILCRPLLLLPPLPPSIKVFSNESVLRNRWPKYWSFSFSISSSNGHPRLTSFRMDWLDLLAVQGTLKSLLQHHSSKASILMCSAFFTVQLSHPYMTTGKTIALTR